MPEITRSQLVLYGSVALIVVILGARYLEGAGAASAPPSPPAEARTAGSRGQGSATAGRPRVLPARPAAEGVLVHVAGAVRDPGVYRLRGDARVRDAVRRAGGAARGADPDAVNLAAKLADGMQVLIPRRSSVPSPTASASGAVPEAAAGAPPAAPISLSSATAEQLDTLDGVGPATAKRILAWRSEHGGFRSIDDVGEVPGIGPKRLAALRPHLQP